MPFEVSGQGGRPVEFKWRRKRKRTMAEERRGRKDK